MTSGRFTVIVIAAALVAIVALVVSGIDFGGGDDKGGGGDRAADTVRQEQPEPQDSEPDGDGDGDAEQEATPEPEEIELPENPDDVRGSQSFALTRAENLRRGLSVLDERRREVEGVFDGLRVAPGRIDTVIVHPDDRRTNIQLRPDFEISFESTHDFPTQPDFRKGGLTARDVDPGAVAAVLRGAQRIRRGGDVYEDVDYCVVGKDIIEFTVDVSCYMRLRTARPRSFLKEKGEKLRAID